MASAHARGLYEAPSYKPRQRNITDADAAHVAQYNLGVKASHGLDPAKGRADRRCGHARGRNRLHLQ
ncbi:uncharacterized protein N7479_010848 [Penicillium vulpinum]|uniref:uncharacterized protein n=1 Tax=Penicillium vulpinum TaxID=29845 RepID=UPI00254728FB|nr:uncharacterized protein N7479_010848 [Penicillium vulpinum]KAJ5952435.1 hypothetical protein N7479_010848 [Penicillium vulpinum]